jgi:hypothetical protein
LSVFPLEILLEKGDEGIGRGCGDTGATTALEELFVGDMLQSCWCVVELKVAERRTVVSGAKQSGFK